MEFYMHSFSNSLVQDKHSWATDENTSNSAEERMLLRDGILQASNQQNENTFDCFFGWINVDTSTRSICVIFARAEDEIVLS